MSRSTDRRRAFLLALTELTKEHGVAIGGCGCCGSPWLDDDADVSDDRAGYAYDGNLLWVTPSDRHDWREYSDKIVRADGET